MPRAIVKNLGMKIYTLGGWPGLAVARDHDHDLGIIHIKLSETYLSKAHFPSQNEDSVALMALLEG